MKLTKEFINTMPTFGDILIEFNEGEVEASILVYSPHMTATTTAMTSLDDPKTGSFKLSKNFVNKLKLMCTNEVEVTFGENYAVITSAKGKYKENYITTMFEKVKDTYKPGFTLNGKQIEKALGFVGKNEKKLILTGINISATHIIATDSIKAYYAGTYNPTETITLIPECAKLMTKANQVTVSIGERTVLFDIGDGWKYTSVFLAEKYPDMTRVLEYFEHGTELDLTPAKEYLEIASSDSVYVKLSSQGGNNGLFITTEDYNSEIEMDVPEGGVEITLTSAMVKDLCKFGLFRVSYKNGSSPLLSFGEEDKALFLPVR